MDTILWILFGGEKPNAMNFKTESFKNYTWSKPGVCVLTPSGFAEGFLTQFFLRQTTTSCEAGIRFIRRGQVNKSSMLLVGQRHRGCAGGKKYSCLRWKEGTSRSNSEINVNFVQLVQLSRNKAWLPVFS